MRSLPILLLSFAALAANASRLHAQCLPSPTPPELAPPCREHYPRWTGEVASLGVNSLLGALSAGVVQELRGGSFRDGFTRGAPGGAVIYVAKRIVVGKYYGAGLLGREVGAIGESVIHNAAAGRPSLSELVLPIGGIARVYVRPSTRSVRVVPDLTAIGYTIEGVRNKGLRLDLKKSVSFGTPVFFTDNKVLLIRSDSSHAAGLTESGVIFLADVPAFGPNVARINASHERVHMIQEDQLFLTITNPFEDWAVTKIPLAGTFIAKRIDINLASKLLDILAGEMPKFLNRPWETEAVFFEH